MAIFLKMTEKIHDNRVYWLHKQCSCVVTEVKSPWLQNRCDCIPVLQNQNSLRSQSIHEALFIMSLQICFCSKACNGAQRVSSRERWSDSHLFARAGESGINSSETQEQDDHYQCFKTSFLFSSELASSHRQSRWSVLAPPEARARACVGALRFISSRDLR